EEPEENAKENAKENPNCCDVCNPDSMLATIRKKFKFLAHNRPDYIYTEEDEATIKKLVTEWRSEAFAHDISATCGWMTEATVIADGKLEDLTKMCSKVIPDLPESFKTVLGWRPLRDGYVMELSDLLSGFKLEKDILGMESTSTDTTRERGRLMLEEFKEVSNVYKHGDALVAESEALSTITLDDFVATSIWNPPKLKKPRATTPMAAAVTSSDSGGLERSSIANRILNSEKFQYRIAPPRFDATTERPKSPLQSKRPIQFKNSSASNFDATMERP
ncbi:hypothetical protein BGX26_008479, partial [Mortierella sp. AD094]